MPIEEIHRTYKDALMKAEKLVDKQKIECISYSFYCKSLEDFILRISLSDIKKEWKDVLVASLEYTRDFPEKLNNLTGEFYTNVAEKLRVPTNYIGSTLRRVFRISYDTYNSEGRLFFKQGNIRQVRNIPIKMILEAAVACIK